MLQRYFLAPLLLAGSSLAAQAQTGGVGIGTTTPSAAAALEIKSTTQGLLLPRLTLAQRTALGTGSVAAPVPGLVIYQTDNTPGLYAYDGTAWVRLVADNLGNHTATQNLNLGANKLVGNNGSTGLTISSTGVVTTAGALTTGGNASVGGTLTTSGAIAAGGNVNLGTNALVGNSGSTGLSISSAGAVTAAGALTVGGTTKLTGLAGTGTRAVTTDASGTLGSSALPTDAQTLSLSSGTLSISGVTGSGASVTLPDASTTNELQTISKAGSTVTLSNGGGSFIDADAQTLSINGSTISIAGVTGTGASVTVPSSADNLGNHTATTTLGLNDNWLSNSAGTANGIRVDNAGNVGVGTASPGHPLTVQADAGSRLLGFSTSTGVDKYNWSLSGGGLNLSESNVAGGRLFVQDGGNVGLGTTSPAASAALDVSSTTKGLLPPRLTTAQRDAVPSPATGLMVYNTTTTKLNTWNGTAWEEALSTATFSTPAASTTFSYTGGTQTYTVPSNAVQLRVTAIGASGVNADGTYNSGQGGRTVATIPVTPGEVLQVYVGQRGTAAGGFNGGGSSTVSGIGGGGATDLRRGSGLAGRLLVAGGGAGSPWPYSAGSGGNPGGGSSSGGGQGGTATAGGAGSTYLYAGQAGSLGQGGSGGVSSRMSGGGGGGGYYGGGGGGVYSEIDNSPGGGGSSWASSTAKDVTFTYGGNVGDGSLTIEPLSAAAPAFDGSNISNVPGTWSVSGSDVYRAAGSVGIGTSSPTQKLDVEGGILARSNGAISNQGAHLQWNRSGGDGETWLLNQRGGGPGGMRFGAATTANVTTEWARFDAAGNLGLGNTNPGQRLDVSGNANVSGNAYVGSGVSIGTSSAANGLHVDRPESSSTTALGVLLSGGSTGNPSIELRGNAKSPYIDFVENAGLDFSTRLISQGGTLNLQYGGTTTKPSYIFNVLGGIQCTALNNTSDQRLKQDIRPLSGALASVLALRGVRYQWNALGVQRGGTAGTEQVGLLAQEVEKVFPELVSTGPDGYKAVNYAQLTPVLLEALKEQQAQIEALQHLAADAKARAVSAETKAAQATATLETFEARLRRLEAAGGQARR